MIQWCGRACPRHCSQGSLPQLPSIGIRDPCFPPLIPSFSHLRPVHSPSLPAMGDPLGGCNITPYGYSHLTHKARHPGSHSCCACARSYAHMHARTYACTRVPPRCTLPCVARTRRAHRVQPGRSTPTSLLYSHRVSQLVATGLSYRESSGLLTSTGNTPLHWFVSTLPLSLSPLSLTLPPLLFLSSCSSSGPQSSPRAWSWC